MPEELEYHALRVGHWRLRVSSDRWNQALQDHVFRLVGEQPPSPRAQTIRFRFPDPGGEILFLKVFHWGTIVAAAKDMFRESKAFRSLRQSVALSQAGFLVPPVIAAGEARRRRVVHRAFLLTMGIEADPLPVFLGRCYREALTPIALARKRNGLHELGRQIRRLHRAGFVHGDLVPSNILVAKPLDGTLQFYILDNDRTRRYPRWLPQSFWKRNLVQLNRVPLAGITLQDRLRFFRGYLPMPFRSRPSRVLREWLERKTRRRRKECDPAYASASFRKLMRWSETP